MAGLPLVSQPAAASHTLADKTIALVKSDYETAAAAYFGEGATAYVVLKRAASDVSSQRDVVKGVHVTSGPLDDTGFDISLLETGARTGVFIGSFGFAGGTSDTATEEPSDDTDTEVGDILSVFGPIKGDGKIAVKPDVENTIEVKAPFADVKPAGGKTADTPVKAFWRPTHTGAFHAFDQDGTDVSTFDGTTVVFGYSGTILFQLVDSDLNLATLAGKGRETYNTIVLVTSTSDPKGEFVKMIETGDNTAIFQGTLQLEAARVADNGKLYVRNGDSITATYFEAADDDGQAVECVLPADDCLDPPTTGGWTFQTVANGVPAFDRTGNNFYYGLTHVRSTGADRATIILQDVDRDTGAIDDNVTVTVQSLSDDNTFVTSPLVLHEVGGQGGLFVGTLGFTDGASSISHDPPLIKVGATTGGKSDKLTVTYADLFDATGKPVQRTAQANWLTTQTGILTLGDPDADELATVVAGTTDEYQVQLEDFDANRNPSAIDQVQVGAASASDAHGITFNLVETSDSSGRFVGTIKFSTSSSSATNHVLKVTDRDFVQLFYNDAMGVDGRFIQVRANDVERHTDPDAASTYYGGLITWRAATDAQVFLDAAIYQKQKTAAEPGTLANVYVIDQDRNDPTRADMVEALATTVGVTPAQTFALTMREVGVDSGIFHAELPFSDSDPDDGLVVPGSGSTSSTQFRIDYLEPLAADGSNPLVHSSTASFQMNPVAFARMEVSKTTIPMPGAATGVTYGVAANKAYIGSTTASSSAGRSHVTITVAGYKAADPTTIHVASTRCTAGKDVDGVRENAGELRFAGTLTLELLAAAPSGTPDQDCGTTGSNLGVLQTDTLTIMLPGGSTSNTALVRPVTGATLTVEQRDLATSITIAHGEREPAYLHVKNGVFNSNSLSRDLISVDVTGARAGETTTVWLLEQNQDDGSFVGSIVFTQDSPTTNDANAANVVQVDAELLKRAATGSAAEDNTYHYAGNLEDGIAANVVGFAATKTSFRWVPTSDGILALELDDEDVPIDSFYGSQGNIIMRLIGDDGQTGRIRDESHAVQNVAGSTTTRSPTLTASTKFVSGSENVYGPETTTGATQPNGGSASSPITVLLNSAGKAAEPISDRNRNGVVDCSDVTLTSNAGAGPVPPQTHPTPTCLSVDAATGAVNLFWPSGSNACASACTPIVTYQFRAMAVTGGTGSAADSFFRYTRTEPTATSITLGGASGSLPAAGTAFLFDFTPASRDVAVKSYDFGSFTPRESATLQLTFPRSDEVNDADASNAFEIIIKPETSASDAQKILVGPADTLVGATYQDPFLAFTGKAGSNDPFDLRSQDLYATWKASSLGQIRYMLPDFSAAAVSPVFGPCVPVQVTDADADISSARDTIDVTVRLVSSPFTSKGFVLRETDAHSGTFRGILRLRTADVECDPDTSDGDELFFQGSQILVTYGDDHGDAGLPLSRDLTTAWRPSEIGTLKLMKVLEDGSIEANEAGNAIRGTEGALFVTLDDADANVRPTLIDSVTVTVFSSTKREGIPVLLTEQGVNTGQFASALVRFKLTEDQLGGTGRLLAKYGDRVQATYTDPRDDRGDVVQLNTKPTRWLAASDGAVGFDFDLYIGDAFFDNTNNALDCTSGHIWKAGEISMGILSLSDNELNEDPLAVDVVDPTDIGMVVGLIDTQGEVGDDLAVAHLIESGANTGVFLAPFSFDEGGDGVSSPSCGDIPRLSVADGNRFGILYTDLTPASGFGELEKLEDARWFKGGHGVVVLDQPGYKKGDSTHTSTVGITLFDSDVNNDTAGTSTSGTGPAQILKVPVRVSSQADPNGFTVMLTETAHDAQIFKGSIKLADTTSSTSLVLKVNGEDVFTVIYQDLVGAGYQPRTVTAPVSGDFVAPITTIVGNPAPTKTEGKSLVFDHAPLISFSTNDAQTLETDYLIGTTCTAVPTSGGTYKDSNDAFMLAEGCYRIQFFSVDKFGNKETVQDWTILVDLSAPTSVVSNLAAVPVAGGKIQLSWAAPSTVGNPLEVCTYQVFRDAQATPIGEAKGTACAAPTTYTDGSLTDESEHAYKVAVVDQAGKRGPFSATVTATPDATKPTLSAPFITPTSFDTRAKPSGGIAVRVDASDAHLDQVVAELKQPNGNKVASTNLTGTGPTKSGTIDISQVTQPCTCALDLIAKDIAGNQAVQTFTILISGPDTQKPEAEFDLPSDGLPFGDPLTVTVSDNVGLLHVSYSVDDGEPVTVSLPNTHPTFTFDVPAALLPVGDHTVTIEIDDNATALDGSSASNHASIPFSFTVLESGGNLPGSFFLPTTAKTRSDGSIVVSWTVPDDVEGVAGFQIWRAASPFKNIGNSSNPNQRTYVDSETEDGKAYRYVVSFFTGSPFGAISQVPGFTSEDNVPASGSVSSTPAAGLPQWLWVVLIVGAIVVVAALIAIMFAGRRGGSQQVMERQAPPPPPAAVEEAPMTRPGPASETHRLRCPQCSHRFEVAGKKPIVTNCPNCGRKGILR